MAMFLGGSMNNKWKLPIAMFFLFFIFRTASAQLTLLNSINNDTWRNIYGEGPNVMLYGLPAAVCSAKQDSDTAPSQYALQPTVFTLDAFSNALIYQFWDTKAQAFGYRRFEDGFSGPRGVISFSNGDIYVADTNNNRLVKLNILTNTITPKGRIGNQGNDLGQFNMPFELNTDANGNIYEIG